MIRLNGVVEFVSEGLGIVIVDVRAGFADGFSGLQGGYSEIVLGTIVLIFEKALVLQGVWPGLAELFVLSIRDVDRFLFVRVLPYVTVLVLVVLCSDEDAVFGNAASTEMIGEVSTSDSTVGAPDDFVVVGSSASG